VKDLVRSTPPDYEAVAVGLCVEQHDQLGYCLVIADIEFTQEGGYIGRIHKNLESDDQNPPGREWTPESKPLELKNIEKMKAREDPI
jgi:hypothetical protein